MEAIRGGRAADAEQLLGIHLRTILVAAKGGVVPKPATLARAADLALELALTGRPVWVDFTVDLLSTLRSPPKSKETMDRLERAARLSGKIDVESIARWARMLRHRVATLEAQDLDRLDRLEALVVTLMRSGR
jgi:hypothetical protein